MQHNTTRFLIVFLLATATIILADSVAAGLSLSRAMMKNGRKTEAATLLKRILALYPRNLSARKSLDELEPDSKK